MQQAGARQLREDDRHLKSRRPRLRAVEGAHRAQASPEPLEVRVDDEYVPAFAEDGRRTVRITGQPMPPRRRPSITQSQIEARPDRVALWAVLLGLFLVFMAVATANAAPA